MSFNFEKHAPWAAAALGAALAALAYVTVIVTGSPFSAASEAGLAAIALLAAIGGVILARRSRSDLKAATRHITELASGHPGNRLYVKDIESSLGKLELELNALMDRLQDSLAKQRQFVSAVSHDIRTPLTILKGNIEVALIRRRTHEEYIEILSSNLEEVERIHRLVEDLVTLARADYGGLGLNVRAVALGSLVAEVREGFVEAARKKGLILESYIEGEAHLEGDKGRLRQLVHNLIDNAIHYTPPGGRVEVSLAWTEGRDEVQLRVRDTGIGISPRDLPHVFEPFYRGTHSRRTQHDGYGLGLAICEHIVRAHSGRISVDSRQGPGSGTTFLVHLPLRPKLG